jgi:truncated hemoglobin YjbI
MAYETRVYLEGQNTPDTQKMKSFMANPANHMSYGFSRRWNIPMRQIPKGLDAEEFSQWLWQPAETADNYDSSDSDF